MMNKIKIFNYLPELDAFILSKEYQRIVEYLGLAGWESYAWIGRLFTMDNDFGEHWFDNWDLREKMSAEAEKLGLDESELLIIDPSRLSDGKDGPSHTDEFRKKFWTEVLQNLEISLDLIVDEARENYKILNQLDISDFQDFEERADAVINGNF